MMRLNDFAAHVIDQRRSCVWFGTGSSSVPRGGLYLLVDGAADARHVDCFRYRAKVGIDAAMEGLREGLRQRKATSDQLWRYATKVRIGSTMKPYVEATAADGA